MAESINTAEFGLIPSCEFVEVYQSIPNSALSIVGSFGDLQRGDLVTGSVQVCSASLFLSWVYRIFTLWPLTYLRSTAKSLWQKAIARGLVQANTKIKIGQQWHSNLQSIVRNSGFLTNSAFGIFLASWHFKPRKKKKYMPYNVSCKAYQTCIKHIIRESGKACQPVNVVC